MIILGLIVGFLAAFRAEIGQVLHLWQPFLASLRGERVPASELSVYAAIFTLVVNCALGVLMLFLCLWLVSQFVLPAQTPEERLNAFKYFLLHILHLHGASMVIRDGKMPPRAAENPSALPGVAVVDYNSAVVLEKEPAGSLPQKVLFFLLDVFLNRRAGSPVTRVAGPGVVFTGPAERIRSAVDLRVQVCSRSDVLANTYDGIGVKSRVYAEFTLGQAPDVLLVTYDGEEKAENLRVIQLDKEKGRFSASEAFVQGKEGIFYRESEPGAFRTSIKDLLDELDAADKEEIDQYVKRNRPALSSLGQESDGRFKRYLPLSFSEKRVTAAVYSRARDAQSGDLGEWTDLVSQVIVDVFRDIISGYRYDELYLPDKPEEFPLFTKIKPEFSRRIRNAGVLSFRFVRRRGGQALKKGDVWDVGQLRFSPVQELQGPKVLRRRGIKILSAGFSEIRPSDEAVRQQRLDNWRARWQREIDTTRASRDLEVSRIRSRARADTLRQMTYTLSQIFQQSQYSKQAMAVRLFQALETAATDPATRQLLPRETIGILRSLGHWLLVDRGEGMLFLDESYLDGEEPAGEGPVPQNPSDSP